MTSTVKTPPTGICKDWHNTPAGVTPWYPASTRPERTGLYQVLCESSPFSSEQLHEIRWCWFDADAQSWGWAYTTKRDALALQWRKPLGATQARIWRGLAEPA